MKKIIIIILIAIIGIYIAYRLFGKKKAGAIADGVPIDGNLVPVDTDAPDTADPLFTDSGEGAITIATRMKQLKDGGEYTRAAAAIPAGAMFAGLQNAAPWQQTLVGPSFIAFPLLDKSLVVLNDTKNLSEAGDRVQTMRTMQRANLSWYENGLPYFLPEQFKGGGEKDFLKKFICPNYGDCPSNYDLHRNSDRFAAAARLAIADVKTLSNNILEINNQLNNAVREKAISDLVAKGWKFVGY